MCGTRCASTGGVTPEVIMDVTTIKDALENAREGEAVEAPSPPGELTMQQLSRILAGVDTFKECITENENCSVRITEMVHQLDKVMRYYTDLHSKKMNERRQTLITRFRHTPATDAPPPPPPPPGLAPSAEDNDEVDFLGFEGVLQEAENLMRDQGANDSDSDNGDSSNDVATGSTSSY